MRSITGSFLRYAAVLMVPALSACARGGAVSVVQPRAFDFAHVADSIIATPPLHRAHLGLLVYDPQARRVLYEHNGERRFVPASNQKLWPTATALHELGAAYRYRTPVLGVGFDAATGSTRALIVVGRGDPTLSARFHAADHAALNALADSIFAAGVRHLTGDLIIDASAFDQAIIPGAWTFGNLNGTSAPPTGAFVIAEGLFRVMVSPGSALSAPALVQPEAPPGVVPVLNRVTTVASGRAALSVTRGPWNDTLRIVGTVVADSPARTLRLPMTDPVRFAAHALAEALRARGVSVAGRVVLVHEPQEAAELRNGRLHSDSSSTPPTELPVRELTAWTSPPLGDIVAAILGPSQNWIAEQLVRTLGAERGNLGSWNAGLTVQRGFLFGPVGIDSAALRMNDGSGMSPQNLVTPRAIVQLLDYARTAEWSPVFRAALAQPGRPGTLSNRLQHLEGRVAGKTGTLNSVNALSGYVRTRDGRELIFSFISNASGLAAGPVVAALDKLVTTLADGNVPR